MNREVGSQMRRDDKKEVLVISYHYQVIKWSMHGKPASLMSMWVGSRNQCGVYLKNTAQIYSAAN